MYVSGSSHAQAPGAAERLLSAFSLAAERLIGASEPEVVLPEVLAALGEAAGAARVSMFETSPGADGALVASRRASWSASGAPGDPEEPSDRPWVGPGPSRWVPELSVGETVVERISDLPEAERGSFHGADTALAAPVSVDGDWWGHIELERTGEEPWHETLVDAVATVGRLLGAALGRAASDREVRESEKRYRTLIEQIPAITYIDACDGPQVDNWPTMYISPQIESVLGYTSEEWRNDDTLWSSLVHADDRDTARAADERHYTTSEPLHSEYRLIARDGHVVWILDTATIVAGSDGLRYSLGVLSDVTDRKVREEELRAAEERFRALVEHTPAVTYQEITTGSYDGSSSMIYVSPQIERILGYPAESWWTIPGFWMSIMHPDDLEAVLAESDRTTAAGDAYSQEYRMVAQDGHIVWLHDEAVVLQDEEGKPQLWQGVMMEITAQKETEERLRATQQRYRALVEHIPAVTYTEALDAAPEGFYISPQARTLFGYDPEEWRWTEHFWSDHIHPDDRERVHAEDVRTNETGERYEIEYRIIAKDGRVVWIHDEATLIAGEGDEPSYWQGFMLDVTERKQADENVRAAETKFRALVEQNPAIIYTDVIDPAGHSTTAYMSPRTEAVTGYTLEEFKEDPDLWRKLLHPEDQERVLEEDIKTNRTAEAFDMQYRIIAKDGHVVWLHDQATLVRDSEGLPSFWQGFLLDITEQKRAQTRFREGEIKYRSLVENIPAVTYVEAVDESKVDFFMSPQVESVLGYSPEEWAAVDDFWDSHIHPDDFEAVREEDERTDASFEPFDVEYRFRHKDGRWMWLHESAVVVKDEEGNPHYWQGFMLDITERREAEQAVAHALEIEREATARLRSLDEMKNTFLQAVSHDLRTPLAAILGLAVTLERADLDLDVEEANDLARRISGNARKLDRLVTDLLDLDRLARGIVEPKLHPTDVAALVRRVVSESDVSGVREIVLEVEPVVVPVDASKVERIVENLLSNTVRHTPTGSRVWVRVVAESGGALIVVEDEGPGVSPDFRQAVFEPFLQGPDAPAHSPGVGVGLALVARFAELHHGRAWVEERTGGGASFRVFLPPEASELENQVLATG